MKTVFAVLACAFSTAVFAVPPPPQVTVAATDVRQLEFNWDPVPGAQTYELWFSSAPGAPWAHFGTRNARRSPTWRLAVPVHLLNWAQATYLIKACNSGGCSESNHVAVNDEKLAAIGFFKPQALTGHHMYGSRVALSADGKTMAVLTGETLGNATSSLVVHIYRQTTDTSRWRREARLLPTYVKANTHAPFDQASNLALSGDGNVLALGSFREPASRAGLPENAGAVYLFRRYGTLWSLSQKIQGAGLDIERFGAYLDLDDAGRTLAVSHNYRGGNYEPGTLEIYRDPVDASDQFVHDRTIPVPPRVDAGDLSECNAIALSGDGNTLMRECLFNYGSEGYTFVHTGPTFAETARIGLGLRTAIDLSYDGKAAIILTWNGADTYRLTPTGWQYDGLLARFEGIDVSSARHVAISSDGKIAAVGNPLEYTVGLGPVYPPYVAGPDEFAGNGGVVVHQRKASGWEIRRLVKPGSHYTGWAGYSLALGDNGKVLAVGAPKDASAAAGIDGDRDDTSAPERGAVWLY